MGKQRNRQLQDGRGVNNYQYKKEGAVEGFPANTSPEKFLSERKIELKARNEKQQQYIDYLKTKNLVIATGFAGSSKTYCPTMVAAQNLRDRVVVLSYCAEICDNRLLVVRVAYLYYLKLSVKLLH